ncbi:MAG: hypothetical protein H6668_01395 [Ardenticatenaceae bacterium]|nr:hypothetical protein [Ardenticatenaceae bacterium]
MCSPAVGGATAGTTTGYRYWEKCKKRLYDEVSVMHVWGKRGGRPLAGELLWR